MGVACKASRMEAWPDGWRWIVAPFIHCSHWLFPQLWGWGTSTLLKGTFYCQHQCQWTWFQKTGAFFCFVAWFHLPSHFPDCLIFLIVSFCRVFVLWQEYSYTHLSAGDLLREERAREGSEYGQLISTHIKEGKIVPVQITIKLLQKVWHKYDRMQFRFSLYLCTKMMIMIQNLSMCLYKLCCKCETLFSSFPRVLKQSSLKN